LNHFSSMFRRYRQEDAHEFMQCVLDKLDSCFLDLKKNDPKFEGDNIVKKVFGGSLVSRLRCCNCGRSSDTNEPLIDLSLEIENVDTLSSALDSFTTVEDIDAKFKCEGCSEEVSMEKQLMLDQTPSIAAFHLKRFKTYGVFIEKIDKHINFPLELDMQPYTISNDASSKYDLYAVVVHTGFSSTSGHYFSFVRTAPDTWHKLDDSMVTMVSEETVLSQEAYILFYARQGTPWFSSFAESTIPCLNLSRMNTSPKSVLDITDGQDKSFSILNENIEKSGAGKSKEFSEKSDHSCQQSRKFPENDDVIDASPCRKQVPAGPSNQKNLHLNGSEDISAQVLPVNYASPTGIAKPGGSSYAENVAPDKNKCSLEANDFIENDVFNALTPPNSPPSQTPGD
jgi:ubiquitin carboxyl-terminal hydrolase 36/42